MLESVAVLTIPGLLSPPRYMVRLYFSATRLALASLGGRDVRVFEAET